MIVIGLVDFEESSRSPDPPLNMYTMLTTPLLQIFEKTMTHVCECRDYVHHVTCIHILINLLSDCCSIHLYFSFIEF
jgi:hypothetical protein